MEQHVASPRPKLVLVHSEGILLEVSLEDRAILLAGRERALLSLLARSPGAVVFREALESALQVTSTGLYDLVYDLRRKLGAAHVALLGGRSKRAGGTSSGYALSGLDVSWVEIRLC